MKFNFTLKALNSPFDDSVFFVRNVYKKRAFLFDCGRMGNLDNSELLDISHVFVSHTHMDHFSGFDRFLRGCLNSGNTINFYGPEGFIRNVEGRLAGYTWNLITDYSLTFNVTELSYSGNKSVTFAAADGFKKKEIEAQQGVIPIGDGFMLDYDFFDHGIPSIGYRVIEPQNISICKDKLKANGFLSGIWLKELKDAIKKGLSKDSIIKADTVEGVREFTISQVEQAIVSYPVPQDITYITDMAPTYDNYKKAAKFATNSCLLIIEAVFTKKDIIHAIEKKHMTVDLSRLVFKESKSLFVRFHHFAPRYDRDRDEFFKELNEGLGSKIFHQNKNS